MEVRTATLEDAPRVADTMARAFVGEAMLRWSFPGDDFEARLRRHFSYFDTELTRRGWVRIVAEAAGAAVWVPSDGREEEGTIGAAPPNGEGPILGDRAEHHEAFWTWVEERRPDEPHVHLSHIGVAPERQGQGLGSVLMRDGVERADAEGVPIWLETSKANNAAYYERFGFRVAVDEDAPGAGPHIWFMRRDPA
jgi:ribosomal protein S18 acetylase RimI-like enzyme